MGKRGIPGRGSRGTETIEALGWRKKPATNTLNPGWARPHAQWGPGEDRLTLPPDPSVSSHTPLLPNSWRLTSWQPYRVPQPCSTLPGWPHLYQLTLCFTHLDPARVDASKTSTPMHADIFIMKITSSLYKPLSGVGSDISSRQTRSQPAPRADKIIHRQFPGPGPQSSKQVSS